MIHLSEQVKLVELEIKQVIVKSHVQHTYFEETMNSSQPEFYANTSVSSQYLSRRHYIHMYLGGYPAKL